MLTHVSVLPSARGSGAGTELVAMFVESARAAGADVAQLVTMAGQAGAGDFYQRLGWEHRGDRIGHDRMTFSVFALELGDEQRSQ